MWMHDSRQDTLNETNYDTFFAMALEGLVRPWEKLIMGMRFSEVRKCFLNPNLRDICISADWGYVVVLYVCIAGRHAV